MRIRKGVFLSHRQIGRPQPPPPATDYRNFLTTKRRTADRANLTMAEYDSGESITMGQLVGLTWIGVRCRIAFFGGVMMNLHYECLL